MDSLADLRQGRWEDVLCDVECDLLFTDTPFSERTHRGAKPTRKDGGNETELAFKCWTPDHVHAFTNAWNGRVRGWWAIMTDHVLVPAWEDALRGIKLRTFAPIPILMRGMTCRMAGDGPSSWVVWLMVARPKALYKWGTLPGFYQGSPRDSSDIRPKELRMPGSKPLWTGLEIIKDYSRPEDVVCDPMMGAGVFPRAALDLDRGAIGAESDPETFKKAQKFCALSEPEW